MSRLPCPNATIWKPSCKKRSCAVCGERWGRDWLSNTRLNLEAAGGPVVMVAITPPGADVLPWDRARCRTRDPKRHRCNGKNGCRVVDRVAREWSDTASLRWSWLRRAARQAVTRAGLEPPKILERVWELQLRGVPHLHVVLPYGTPAQRCAAQRFVDELARLAPAYSFGFVDRKLRPMTALDAAKYLSAYLVGKTAKRKATIVETARVEAVRRALGMERLPRSLLWLTPDLTRRTGVTIRSLRRARHLWACAHDAAVPRPSWSSFTDQAAGTLAFARLFRRRQGDDDDGLIIELERWLAHARMLDWHVREGVVAPYRARALWERWTAGTPLAATAAAS